MISEMMTNGHIMTYISVEKADRLGLVRPLSDHRGKFANHSHS